MDSFVAPGKLDSLSVIRERINKAAASAGLSTDATYKLVLALDEIATNIILHGYEENGRSGDIVVVVEETASEFIVTLEDSAPAYDPRARKMPGQDDLSKPLEEREIGGLGVYLAMQGVDRFDYEFKDNKNRNIFAMKLKGSTS